MSSPESNIVRDLIKRPSTRTVEIERQQLLHILERDESVSSQLLENHNGTTAICLSNGQPVNVNYNTLRGLRKAMFDREMDLSERSPELKQWAWEQVAGWPSGAPQSEQPSSDYLELPPPAIQDDPDGYPREP